MPADPPADIARWVWDAALAGADTAYPRGAERLFVLLQRLFPKLVDAAVRHQLRRLRLDAPSVGQAFDRQPVDQHPQF
ncbi:hypothetical protein [Nitrospirillum sp. BR 11828]|uniref:hypothetical protein n=1 Tax=Nitrospirillum sp. BR 11828 TaxID=3104325 RepID=UPI002ACAB575|nr:hypothetical protein [Nitrospirillum sp. BR 11828]MDZ5650069.1 hypothetical protein [Nitrospirillum sp. BR 11828]